MSQTKDELLKYFPTELREVLTGLSDWYFEQLTEIRLRPDRPLIFKTCQKECSISEQGYLVQDLNKGYVVSRAMILQVIELISGFSMYAFEKQIKNGYLTLQGGHRVGITGTAVLAEGQWDSHLKTLKDFGSVNIRVARQVYGAADKLLPHLWDGERARHTLIVSPPACGKTTMLRDAIRQLSYGTTERTGLTVGVVDERQEIAASYQGVAQNDLGPRTDVLDSCPKAIGMVMLLRAMSPHVIAVDEVGTPEDVTAIEQIVNSGVAVLATVHGNSMADILAKPALSHLTRQRVFERYVVLAPNSLGEIAGVYDRDFELIAGNTGDKTRLQRGGEACLQREVVCFD